MATGFQNSKSGYAKNDRAKLNSSKMYYGNHKESVCGNRRARYILAEPKADVKELYLKHMQVNMLGDSEARFELTTACKKRHATQMRRVLGRTVCRLAARDGSIKPCRCAMSMHGLCSKVLGRSRLFRHKEGRILFRAVILCRLNHTFMTQLISL